ncbi:MAG TPA: hypothetical protein VFJ02_01215 [Vicinamibacterales bacterium]|nr:hypothetical protein [Vicinamibacterales bacterium]
MIGAITIQGSRAHEPAAFADVSESVSAAADVRDDETPVAQLTMVWSSSVGTFSGSGPNVTWQAPAQAETPQDVTLRLEVIERYGPATAPASLEHRVSSSAVVRLHNSIKEVGDMARQFLLDFSDSSIRDVAYIMRNFEPGCYGTAEETAQVAENRAGYQILASSVGAAAVTVNFNGVCAFRAKPGDACANVPVMWDSRDLVTGVRGVVRGTDQVAAVYVRSRREWRLCDSQFDGTVPFVLRGFIR